MYNLLEEKMRKELKALIVSRYGNQADFAAAAKERESRVSRVIRGREELTPERAERWAAALGCKMEDILESQG